MVRTAKAVSKDPASMSTSAGPSAENSSVRARGERDAGRYALAKGPLGIVLAGLLLVETVMGLIVKSSLPTAITTFVICAMVLLAFLVFFGFFYVWIRKPPGYLHPPSAFRSDESWLASLKTDLRPSESLLPSPKPKRPPVRTDVQSEAGFDTGAAIKASLDSSLSLDESWVQRTGELQGGAVTSTLLMELSNHLQGKSDWGYLKVDADHAWLLSRLFIFVSLLRALRPLPCIVFVNTEGKREKLLGIADPAKVCTSIAKLHTHFNVTLAEILTEQDVPISMSGAIDEWAAINIMTEFTHRLQSQDDHGGDPEWSELSSGWWEHTVWLSPETVRDYLSIALFDPKAAFFRPAVGISDNDFVFEIMKRDSQFVALVGDQGEFRELYDKRRILDEIKNRLLSAES